MQLEINFWLGAALVGLFVILLVAIAWGLLVLLKLGAEIRGTSNNRSVTIAEDCVCKSEFEKHVEANERAHKDLFSKIGGVERGTRHEIDGKFETLRKELHDGLQRVEAKGEDRAEKIHGRINDVLEAVSELRGKVEEKR